jgi:hypothetical protein
MTNEALLYGRRAGDEAWQETILCSQPENFDKVKVLAARDGWGHFRIAEIDLSQPPNFADTIRHKHHHQPERVQP